MSNATSNEHRYGVWVRFAFGTGEYAMVRHGDHYLAVRHLDPTPLSLPEVLVAMEVAERLLTNTGVDGFRPHFRIEPVET